MLITLGTFSATTITGPPRQSWPIGLPEYNNKFRESWLSIVNITKRNQQHRSKSTDQWQPTGETFWTRWRKHVFPERSPALEWMMEAKNVNGSYIFRLPSHDIAKRGNRSEEIAGTDDKITACVKETCLLDVVCKVSNRKTLSGETFCLPEKGLLSMLNLVLRVTYWFFTSCWLTETTNFLGMHSYFSVTR